MKKIPLMLVIHEKMDGTDTRLAMLKGPFLCSLLEKWLGVLEQGMYQQARANQSWAFELVEDLWLEELIESELEEENDNGLGVPATSDQSVKSGRTETLTESGLEQAQMIPKTDRKVMKKLYEAVKASSD